MWSLPSFNPIISWLVSWTGRGQAHKSAGLSIGCNYQQVSSCSKLPSAPHWELHTNTIQSSFLSFTVSKWVIVRHIRIIKNNFINKKIELFCIAVCLDCVFQETDLTLEIYVSNLMDFCRWIFRPIFLSLQKGNIHSSWKLVCIENNKTMKEINSVNYLVKQIKMNIGNKGNWIKVFQVH